MPRKLLSAPLPVGRFVWLALAGSMWWRVLLPAAEPLAAAKFVGDEGCSASSCHGGGAGDKGNDAYTRWLKQDVHLRAVVTLGNARSKQIAAAAKLGNPLTDKACTLCHAPLTHVPAALQRAPLEISRGLSCESCHAPAEPWLLSHTRADFTHADRVQAGLRDLANPYVRANQCVACHQAVPSRLLKAGHPKLIFELDGQTKSLPPHWREKPDWHPVGAWLAGQAAAYRELCWQLESEADGDPRVQQQADGLRWLLEHFGKLATGLPVPPATDAPTSSKRKWADELAQAAAQFQWPDNFARQAVKQLAGLSNEFTPEGTQLLLARRAERLALALDRLVASLPVAEKTRSLDASVSQLFESVQSLADFDPQSFAGALRKIAATVEPGSQVEPSR